GAGVWWSTTVLVSSLSAPRTGVDAADRAERGLGPSPPLGHPIFLRLPTCPRGRRASCYFSTGRVAGFFADLEHVLGVRLLDRDRHRAQPDHLAGTQAAAIAKAEQHADLEGLQVTNCQKSHLSVRAYLLIRLFESPENGNGQV